MTQIVLSNLSFTKIDYALTFYLCAMTAIENMYKHGMLAGVLYLIKKKESCVLTRRFTKGYPWDKLTVASLSTLNKASISLVQN